MPPPSGEWTNTTYLQGLVTAVNQRMAAIGPTALTGFTVPAIATPAAGDRADKLINLLQQAITFQIINPSTGTIWNGKDISTSQ